MYIAGLIQVNIVLIKRQVFRMVCCAATGPASTRYQVYMELCLSILGPAAPSRLSVVGCLYLSLYLQGDTARPYLQALVWCSAGVPWPLSISMDTSRL
jgi:hypothetical protein